MPLLPPGGNGTRVGECLDLIYAEVRRSPRLGDNIMADASFHQHGPQLLSGSYGGSFVHDISLIAAHAAPTRWALPGDKLAILASLVLDGDAWSTDAGGGRWDWAVVGREVTRPGGGGCIGIDPAALRALGGPRAAPRVPGKRFPPSPNSSRRLAARNSCPW